MSSLAAAGADNYYYPREWRPEHGSINTFQRSHPLGKRARHITEGVLVVRFEMPFNVWCAHCETHIGRGVRYNARKKQVGKYFTTTVWEFRMPCVTCKHEMVIETDPAQRGYKLVSGVRKQRVHGDENDGTNDQDHAPLEDTRTTEGYGGHGVAHDDAEATGTERVNDASIKTRLAADPFFKLEHENEDRRRAKQRSRGLHALLAVQDTQSRDNYASNAALRAQFRQLKKHLQGNAARAKELGLSIPLLDAQPEDVAAAKATVFKGMHGKTRALTTTATSRTRTARTAKAATSSDSFQFFGDTVGSQLHRLKRAKYDHARTSMSSGNSRVAPVSRRAASNGEHVSSRARRLLSHR